MRTRGMVLAFGCSSLLVSSAAFAQPPDSTAARPRPEVCAATATGPVHVDGILDEEDWKKCRPATLFTQIDPEEGKPASERTEVRVLVDDEALTIGARLFDRDPRAVRAHLARRDDSSGSDLFEVSLDSFHDKLTAWQFDVNPAGSVRDAAIYSDGSVDYSWDAVWDAAATIDSLGWTAEIRIPLSQLHYNHVQDATWGIQFFRLIHRKQERDFFAFTPKKEEGGVSRYGDLTGLGTLPEQRHLELLPYAASRGRFADATPGDPFNKKDDYAGSFGVDMRYGLGPDLTLTGTVNPDFGQAEVDPAVVNLSAYETFYPEKRPFFVADAGNFSFGSIRSMNNFGFGQTFYTRRIGRSPHLNIDDGSYEFVDQPDHSSIAAAAKLTGKTRSGWTIGGLESYTTSEKARFMDWTGDRGEVKVEPATNFLVARVARDLRGGNTQVGGLFTGVNRMMDDATLESSIRKDAYVGGFDWKHAWDRRNWSFDGFFLGSSVGGTADAIAATQRSSAHYYQRPDASQAEYDPTRKSLSGYYGSMAVARNNGEHWLGSLMTQFMSPGYESNDLGYMTRADRYTFTSIAMYQENKPGKIFRNYNWYPFTYHAWNYGGKIINAGYALGMNGTFRNFWSASSQLRYEAGTYNDQLTRGGPIAHGQNSRQGSLDISSDSRKNYNVDFGGSWYKGDSGTRTTNYYLSLSFHPRPGIQVSAGPSWNTAHSISQYIRSVGDPLATKTYGRRYVFANIDQKTLAFETRLNWVFSPRVSLQLYMQPLISSGDYSDYKEFATPGTLDFDVYGRDKGTIGQDSTGAFVVDPDGGGAAPSFGFGDPNFNYRSLRGNAVLRWEYRPGSTLYLIWQQSREETAATGDFSFNRDLTGMFHAPAENILMAKVTTWFGW